MATLAGLLLVALVASPAVGAPSVSAPAAATPAAASPAASATPPVGASAPPVAPTIQVPNSASTTVRASGTATPGAHLSVLDRYGSSLCPAVASSTGAWACNASVSSGAKQHLNVSDGTNNVISAPFDVLTPPVVTTKPGLLVGARLAGTAFPGATVTVSLTAAGGGTRTLQAPVSSAGAWQVLLPSTTVPSDRYTVSATQTSASVPSIPRSNASPTISVTVDRDAPAAPVLLHPSVGHAVNVQPLVFSGTGETGATVTVYVDSNPVCTAVVANGRWSCNSDGLLIPAGTRNVQAAQHDAAGNYGPASRDARVTFTPSPTSAPSTPQSTPSRDAPPAGGSPSDQATPSPSASAVPPGGGSSSGSGGSGGTGGSSGGSGSGSGGGSGQAPGGSGTAAGPGLDSAASWTGATGFGGNLPTLSDSLGGTSWAWALALGLVFILLVVAPLRLAATALGGRLAVRARHFTGRNRTHSASDDGPLLPPTTAVALAIAGGAVLVAVAVGVDDQLRYVRLAIAIVIGVVVINGLGILLPTWISGRRLGFTLRFRVAPRLLAAAAVACAATRLFDLDPPLVLGVLLAGGLVDAAGERVPDVRKDGILATAQLASLAVLSFGAWVAHGLLPVASSSFATEILGETLTTVCLAGLGSLIVLLIPLGTLPGRAIYAWSRSTLVGLGIVGVAVAAVVFAGGAQEAFPVVPLIVVAVAFAVLAMGAWVWIRFVEPAVDDPA